MAVTKTNSMEKRAKRTEKMAASERLTNGFMLTLTYGLGGIIILEIIRRHYLMFAYDFASTFSIVMGIIFAIAAAGVAVLGSMKKIAVARSRNYTIFFVVASLATLFLSFDLRLLISRPLLAQKANWGVLDFLANLNLAVDAKVLEYGVVLFLVVAFIVYAVRLALLEKKK
ncbi:MAG: hypothetical protein IJE44_05800 [Clostridia bacterium]|nr:hypothetical protein [Clostridia bacterium]MBQ6894767.1 hypothetical protein [Clostridia bacterium]